jgi:hypothetical protein
MEFFEQQHPIDRIFAGITFFFAISVVGGAAVILLHLGALLL